MADPIPSMIPITESKLKGIRLSTDIWIDMKKIVDQSFPTVKVPLSMACTQICSGVNSRSYGPWLVLFKLIWCTWLPKFDNWGEDNVHRTNDSQITHWSLKKWPTWWRRHCQIPVFLYFDSKLVFHPQQVKFVQIMIRHRTGDRLSP